MHGDIRCWRDIWDIPDDRIRCIRSAAMFYVVPLATIMETNGDNFLIWGCAPYLNVEGGDHDLYGAPRNVKK
eukprot:2382279-Pleurochrysis_carterae.AAC.1